MDLSVFALLISAASLVTSVANTVLNARALRTANAEKERISEMLWSFYISPTDDDAIEGCRLATIAYRGSDPRDVDIVSVTPLGPDIADLRACITTDRRIIPVAGRMPGWKTSSGVLMSVDVDKHRMEDRIDFLLYVFVPVRPSGDLSFSKRYVINLLMEEITASRR